MSKVCALIALFFFVFIQQVSAHAEGLVPFLKINGSYPDVHPIKQESVVPPDMPIPEDLARESYVVNEEIHFSIETAVLAKLFTENDLARVRYIFDFGDGTKGTGTDITHVYTKPGSKVLTIYASLDDPQTDAELQQIEQVQINVVPFKEYIFAQPTIKVNSKLIIKDAQEVDMRTPVTFEGSAKNTSSADIASYAWDLGEGGSSSEQKTTHTYTTDPAIVTPVLKVTDKNGLDVYTFAVLTNAKTTQGYTFATDTVGAVVLGIQGIIVVTAVIWFTIAVRSKKHTKRS